MRIYGIIYCFFFLLVGLTSCTSDDNPVEPTKQEMKEAGPILFLSNYSDTVSLFSMELDGSDARELITMHQYNIATAVWSPDGEKIVFMAKERTDNYVIASKLFIMDKNCQNIRELQTDNTYEAYHAGADNMILWSPDSRRIAYTKLQKAGDRRNHIFTYDLENDNEQLLSQHLDIDEAAIDWSNNGISILALWYDPDSGEYSYKLYDSVSGDEIRKFEITDTRYHLYKFSDDDQTFLSLVASNVHSALSVYDPEEDNHTFIMEENESYLSFVPVIEWSTSRNMLLCGINMGELHDDVLYHVVDYGIYDLEGNLIQDIPNPFDGKLFNIVSWRMD